MEKYETIVLRNREWFKGRWQNKRPNKPIGFLAPQDSNQDQPIVIVKVIVIRRMKVKRIHRPLRCLGNWFYGFGEKFPFGFNTKQTERKSIKAHPAFRWWWKSCTNFSNGNPVLANEIIEGCNGKNYSGFFELKTNHPQRTITNQSLIQGTNQAY